MEPDADQDNAVGASRTDAGARPTCESPAARHWAELSATIEHCATKVPLYRGLPAPPAGCATEAACRQALSGFPLLTKKRIRAAFPSQFVPEGRSLPEALRTGEVSIEGTSGTTGERVQLLWHQPWWDAQERDGFEAHPVSRALVRAPGYTEAVLTTPVCSGNLCHVGPLPMKERILDDRILFLNQTIDPAHWSETDVRRMADELDRFAPTALEADSAYLAHFAVRLAKLGRSPYRPRFIDVSYEFPSARHKAAITRSFGVPFIDTYGSTECGLVFTQCPEGRYHHNHGWSHAEVLPLERAKGLEGVGLLVLTPLRNHWLNLVRIDTGDLVRLIEGPCPCAAGGGEVLLERIEGRRKDVLFQPDGRAVTPRRVDDALAAVSGLLHYRLVQRGAAEFELDLVADGLDPLDPAAASDAAGSVLEARPRVRVVPSVPVEASGKFRLCCAVHVDADTVLCGGES